MGEDARWVCHTCKTVCNRGGRILAKGVPTLEQIRKARFLLAQAREVFLMDDLANDVSVFLNDLGEWLSRHQRHNIHIGSDYTTDMMDLDSYYNESVDGKVSDATRLELQTRSYEDWRITHINTIKTIIQNHMNEDGAIMDLEAAAAELYDKFSSKEI